MLLLVLAAVLISFIGRATAYLRARDVAKQTTGELQTLQRENKRLRAGAKQLNSLDTVELEARRAGMARPGERVYVIKGLPKDP